MATRRTRTRHTPGRSSSSPSGTGARSSRKVKRRSGAKKLSHLDTRGRARMVDVGAKEVTEREAIASARVRLKLATLDLILDGKMEKGDVFAAARLAGKLAKLPNAERSEESQLWTEERFFPALRMTRHSPIRTT